MKKILFVEDDQSLQKIYSEALSSKDIETIRAVTGKEGLDMAIKNQPDVILLDIMLPGGLNGFDVLTELKKDPKTQAIPVLVLTNLDSERQTAMDLGAVDYAVKAETSIEEVLQKLSKWISPPKTPGF